MEQRDRLDVFAAKLEEELKQRYDVCQDFALISGARCCSPSAGKNRAPACPGRATLALIRNLRHKGERLTMTTKKKSNTKKTRKRT